MTHVQLDDTSLALLKAYAEPLIDKLKDDFDNPSMVLNVLGYMSVVILFEAQMKPGKNRLETFDTWMAALRTTVEQNEKLHAELTAASEAAAAREDGA